MAKTGKSARQALEKQMVAFLTKKGEKIALDALNSVTYKTQTGNLDDSFVWGVYKQGKLVEGAYGCVQQQTADEPRKWYGEEMWGHENAMRYIRGFDQTKAGYALEVVEVMPYGEFVEQKYKYRVIATAQNELKALTGQFKGSRTRIIHRGKAQ